MKFETGHIYHAYNQGNNRQKIFYTREDYRIFLSLVESCIVPYAEMIAWCLLPNHFHFMLQATAIGATAHKQGGITIDLLTNGFRKLLSTYAHDFNKRQNRSGALFRPKTKTKDLSVMQIAGDVLSAPGYYLNCFYYIHQNPFRHGLVKSPALWEYSSYAFYAGKSAIDFFNKQLAEKFCDYNKTTFEQTVSKRLPDEYIAMFSEDY